VRNAIILSIVTSVPAGQVVLNGFNKLAGGLFQGGESTLSLRSAQCYSSGAGVGAMQRGRSPGDHEMEGRGMWRGEVKQFAMSDVAS